MSDAAAAPLASAPTAVSMGGITIGEVVDKLACELVGEVSMSSIWLVASP